MADHYLLLVLGILTTFSVAAAKNTTDIHTTAKPGTTLPQTQTTKKPSTVFTVTSSAPHPSHTATTAKSNTTARCTGKTNCKGCTDDKHCYWCDSTKKCGVYPIKKIVPRDCPNNKWKWKQCVIPGNILIIVVPSIVGLFLLTCGCCIYCKCCRNNKKGWKKTEEKLRQRRRDMEQQHEMRRKERQARQDAIRKKYGLLKDEDEEPLI